VPRLVEIVHRSAGIVLRLVEIVHRLVGIVHRLGIRCISFQMAKTQQMRNSYFLQFNFMPKVTDN
jgi:hypothetical protein